MIVCDNFLSTVQSVSFLYLFYLKMVQLKLVKEGRKKDCTLKIPEVIFQTLAKSKVKIDRLDYILLFLSSLLKGIGEKKLKTLFKAPTLDFHQVWEKLDQDVQERFVFNSLNYSCSIDNKSYFHKTQSD